MTDTDYTCPTCGSTKRDVRGSVYRCIGDYEHSPHPCPDPSHDATPERTLEAMLDDLEWVSVDVLTKMEPHITKRARLEADLRDYARLREAANGVLPENRTDTVLGAFDTLRAALERSHR